MLYHHTLAKGCSLTDWMQVIGHGLKLDCTTAGYVTVIPFLCTLLSVWTPAKIDFRKLLRYYFAAAAFLVAAAFAADLAIYAFWGFRLDATVLFYIQFPSEAMSSISFRLFVLQSLVFLFYSAGIFFWFNRFVVPLFPNKPVKRRLMATVVFLLLGGILFIPVRGGITTSTANVGMVYFSDRQFLNHAAINPAFSLFASLFKQQDFASQFDFFPEEERDTIFRSLFPPEGKEGNPAVELLNTRRPNILLIILESFSANAIKALEGAPGVTPHMNKLCEEGVLFTNVYANSFRTDRGLVALLNGYLAQPTTSIMKYPAKSQTLPSLSKSLIAEGYTAEMLYGGDINFTNMQSYFYSSGYSRIVSDNHFPVSSRLNKWGVNDDITFDYLYNSIMEKTPGEQWMSTFLTLSSHEPFEVPYRRLAHPYLNSVAFTDSCLGLFIDRLRKEPGMWKNLLVIITADHGYRYPGNLQEYEPARYRIPVLWVGGAVKRPAKIATLGAQTDLAATLLGQLHILHKDFIFSKDLLSPHQPAFAFYTFSNGFGFADSSGVSVFDNDSRLPLIENPKESSAERINKGKALLQTLYDDLGKR
ncbi:MAG: LTA synthase family protein/sulfatase/alkaline phosphatase family protein [Bacteroidales bacterium]